MIPQRRLQILLVSSFLSFQGFFAMAQTEVERLTGFAQHQNDNVKFDKAREQGERAYLESEEQWENLKARELSEYKKQAKDRAMSDDGPEFQQDTLQKKAQEKVYEENRDAYLRDRAQKRSLDRKALNLPSEEQELGLDQERPRYDYRKRATFGATPKLGKSTLTPGRSGGSGSSGSYGGGGGSPSFPPPPTFDDFQDGGYIPAPTLDNDYMGDIPPPPPPPPPFGMDGGFNGDGGEFPPPPPPTFGDEGEF